MPMTEKSREDLAKEVGQVTSENIQLLDALATIISESTDAEVIRIAVGAITNTETGRNYLLANPLKY